MVSLSWLNRQRVEPRVEHSLQSAQPLTVEKGTSNTPSECSTWFLGDAPKNNKLETIW